MAWSREVASELADEGSFARGVAYARDGRVERLETSDRSSTATVRGSRPYRVELSGPARPLAWSCDCPVNDDGRFCKHCVAVALVVAGADARSLSPLHDDADAVRARPSVRRAAAAGRAIDVRECRARLRKAFGNGRFIDYLAAPAWEAGVDEALSELDDLLDAGYAVEVVDLVEYAHARVEKAMPHVDDSDGCIGRMSIRLAGLHLRACAGAELDPVKLARRLLELELGAELDTFHRAALTYAKVLGPVGIDEYRRKIEPRFDQLALEPGNDWSHDRFRIRNARIGVALAAGDPDELIAVNTPSLRLPDDYVEIAGLLAPAGRDDEARSWCERGLVAFANRQLQLDPLRELLARLHRDQGDTAAAVDVFWSAFELSPSLKTYRRLVREADQTGNGDPRREAAFDLLNRALDDARRSGSDARAEQVAATIIEVRLFEGDVDAAWRVATHCGCAQRVWLQLARARERDHPEDVIPIYEREIELLIDQKKDGAYRGAVKLMSHVQSLQAGLERPGGFDDLVARVRAVHGRKPNLMRRVAAKGW